MDNYDVALAAMDDDGFGCAITSETARQRPAPLGPRYAPRTAAQLAQFDAGAVTADALLDDRYSAWLTNDDMCGRDPYWVHGYWARYHARVPGMLARLNAQA